MERRALIRQDVEDPGPAVGHVHTLRHVCWFRALRCVARPLEWLSRAFFVSARDLGMQQPPACTDPRYAARFAVWLAGGLCTCNVL